MTAVEKILLTAAEEDAGCRIDRFITSRCESLTRNAVQRLCDELRVLVGGKAVSKNYKLRTADEVCIAVPQPRALSALPQDIPLDILFEDAHLLVVNKPKGMVVHPAAGNEDGTLVNALLHHCRGSLSGINGVIRPGIVHRIDKDTSGLLAVAKTDAAHVHLSAQIKAHTVTRRYQAVVYGPVKNDSGRVDAPIGRHPTDRKKMCVTDKHSRQAATCYRVVQWFDGFTHLALELETGRTHQIRVHMAHIGHPVAGDPVYGPKKLLSSLNGQCLHAGTLGFIHPALGEYMEFFSEPPAEFLDFLAKLQQKRSFYE